MRCPRGVAERACYTHTTTCKTHPCHETKCRIVTCGNFQDVHPDEFTASKTPSCPSFRMAVSVASHMGWPVECWGVSTAFLYARRFGDRDTDLGGSGIFMRPPKILIEAGAVQSALCGTVWSSNTGRFCLPGDSCVPDGEET